MRKGLYDKPKPSEIIFYLVLAGLALLSLLSIGRMVMKVTGVTGSLDFHAYWYAGHFVRQGTDPYYAYFIGDEPETPVYYLDGLVVQDQPVAQPGLSKIPANTAPLVLALSPFAFFSWQRAKLLWTVFNVGFMLLIPWLILWLLPEGQTMEMKWKLLIALSFYSFQSTRVSIWVGQTTLLIFVLMLGTLLLVNKHRLFPGLLLGLALSKYSLSLPVLFLVLLNRRYVVVAIGFLLQLGGILFITLLTGSSPIMQLIQYTRLMARHARLPGLHLGYMFPAPIGIGVSVLLTLVIGGVVFYWLCHFDRLYLKQRPFTDTHTFIQFHLFTIFISWTLLVAYHRVYDTLTIITFVTLVVYGWQANLWQLTAKQTRFVGISLVGVVGVQCLPGQILVNVFPEQVSEIWLLLLDRAITFSLVWIAGISLGLLFQVHKPIPTGELALYRLFKN